MSALSMMALAVELIINQVIGDAKMKLKEESECHIPIL